MYEKDHPVYPMLQKIGKEITEKVKPKAIVVFSAHWQGERDVVEINTSENTDLIYEFVFLDLIPCRQLTHSVSTDSQQITTKKHSQTKDHQSSPRKSSTH